MPGSRPRFDLLRGRVARFTRMLRAVGGPSPNALHRTRVASRRLREVLPVLQLDPKLAAEFGRRLRKITERLGAIRELDVTLQLIEELKDTGLYNAASLDQVAAETRRAREAALAKLPAKWPNREVRRLASKLTQTAERLKIADSVSGSSPKETRALRWAIEARVQRRASALREAIEDAGSVYLPDRLHLVRIALKKFRYAVELANELARDKKLDAQLRLLKRSQDQLGRWHDHQVLIDRTRQLQASLTPPALSSRRLDGLIAALEAECRRLHARYVRDCAALAAVCQRAEAHPQAPAERAS